MGLSLSSVLHNAGTVVKHPLGVIDNPEGFTNLVKQNISSVTKSAPKSNTVATSKAAAKTSSNTVAPSGATSASSSTTGSGQSMANILNQIASKQNSALDSARSNIGTDASQYQTGAGSLISTLQNGQDTINRQLQTAEQNKQQSITSLLNQLRQNGQNDAVKLSSANALGSSAANVFARGEANYGNQQKDVIGGAEQAALDQAHDSQNSLNTQVSTGLAALHQQRDSAVQTIGNQVEDALNQLDYYANGVGLSGKVQIDGLKNQIVQEALGKFSQIDNWLSQQQSGIQPLTTQQAADKAYADIQAGHTNTGNSFAYQDPNNAALNTPAPQPGQATDANGNSVDGAPTALLSSLLKKNDPNQAVTA